MPDRIQAVQTPIIPVVADWIRQSPGTISLGQGVVSYGPPPEAIHQLSEFLVQPNVHHYQSVQGIPSLLEAIATKLYQDNRITLDSNRSVVVTAGSNMGFLNAMLAITSPGDEVILSTPYYFNHDMAIVLAGCKTILVPTDENYQLQPESLEAAITAKTRAIVTISPNNPTGAVYAEADLRAVNRLCRENGIYHISDEAYEYFTYGVPHFSPLEIAGSEAFTIGLYSLSKAYGFASWRIGYMVIPSSLLESVKKIQDTNVICPPVISQYAAVGALQAGSTYWQPRVAAIADVRSQVLQALTDLSDRITISSSEGAFYVFLKVKTSLSSMTVVERLIREFRVAVIPGSAFGMEHGCYLRLAYGVLSPTTIADGLERLIAGLRSLTE